MSRIIDKIKSIVGLNFNKSSPKIKEMVKPDVILSAGAQMLRTMKPHAPMIKFRAGSGAGAHFVAERGAAGGSPSPSQASQQKPVASGSTVTVEDWQLPRRYQRRPISEEEIAYINRGGPE